MPKYVRLIQDVQCVQCEQWIKKGRQVVVVENDAEAEIDWQDDTGDVYCHIKCLKEWDKHWYKA